MLCALGAAGLCTAPASATSASLTLFSPVYEMSSSTLDVNAEYLCNGGGNGEIVYAGAENLTLGALTLSVPCDGNYDTVTLSVPATLGSWTVPGTVSQSAALLDASNVQVADVLAQNAQVLCGGSC